MNNVSDVLSSFDLSDFDFPSSSLEESSQSTPSPTPNQHHHQQQQQQQQQQQPLMMSVNGGMDVDDQDVGDWLQNLDNNNQILNVQQIL